MLLYTIWFRISDLWFLSNTFAKLLITCISPIELSSGFHIKEHNKWTFQRALVCYPRIKAVLYLSVTRLFLCLCWFVGVFLEGGCNIYFFKILLLELNIHMMSSCKTRNLMFNGGFFFKNHNNKAAYCIVLKINLNNYLHLQSYIASHNSDSCVVG